MYIYALCDDVVISPLCHLGKKVCHALPGAYWRPSYVLPKKCGSDYLCLRNK
jgi:hypothetical protein